MATPQPEPNGDTSGEGWVGERLRNGVTIVVVGETGAGKSALVNGLLGPGAPKEATTGFSARAVGKSVEEFRTKRENVEIKLFDTPGSVFGSASSADIFREIADKSEGKIDLLVYCHNMQSRITEKDVTAIGNIADVLCKRSSQNTDGIPWENVIYVLTFANMVERNITEEIEAQGIPHDRVEQGVQLSALVRENFEELHRDICQRMHELTQQIIEEKHALSNATQIANDIPVVPAGFRKVAIPGCNDWLTTLWRVAFSQVNAAKTPAFIDVTPVPPDQPSQQNAHSYKGMSVFLVWLIICAAGGNLLGAYGDGLGFWGAIGITGGAVGVLAYMYVSYRRRRARNLNNPKRD